MENTQEPTSCLTTWPARRGMFTTTGSYAESSSYRPIFHPFYHRNIPGQKEVNEIYRKSKGTMSTCHDLKGQRVILHSSTFQSQCTRIYMQDPCQEPRLSCSTCQCPSPPFRRGKKVDHLNIKLPFWGFQVSPQMSFQPLCLLTWDYGLSHLLLLQPEVPTQATKRQPVSCLMRYVQKTCPLQVLWVDGQEKECVQTAQPTGDAAQASAATVPWVRFLSLPMRL